MVPVVGLVRLVLLSLSVPITKWLFQLNVPKRDLVRLPLRLIRMEPLVVLMPSQWPVPHSPPQLLVWENNLITRNASGLIMLVLPTTWQPVEAYWTKLRAQQRIVNGEQLALFKLVPIRQHLLPVPWLEEILYPPFRFVYGMPQHRYAQIKQMLVP